MNHIPESPVAIVGSRNFPDLEMVRAFVRSLPKHTCIVSGGAKGVDQAAESEALASGFRVRSFRPQKDESLGSFLIVVKNGDPTDDGQFWYDYEVRSGRFPTFARAAHTRNRMIVNESGSVVAFWDGKSKGTKSTIDKAKAAGILFAVYSPDSVTPST